MSHSKQSELDSQGDESQRLSPDKLANRAKGSIEKRDLTKTGNPLRKFLFDKPLLEYLKSNEQPHYLFRNDSRGFRITKPDGEEETPHHNWDSLWARGHRHLLVTDKRILYIVGSKSGDDFREFYYDDISGVSGNQGLLRSSLRFTDSTGTEYKFPARKGLYEVSDAIDYIQKRLDGVITERESRSATRESMPTPDMTPPSKSCPHCDSTVEPEDDYCSKCGTNLGDPTCPACGFTVDENPNFCPDCGYELQDSDKAQIEQSEGTSEDSPAEADNVEEQTGSKYTGLSFFSAVMLAWGGAYSYTAVNRPGESAFFFALAVLIIPQVRQNVIRKVREDLQIDLSGGLVRVIVGSVYVVLVGSVALLMIGEAVNDPDMTPWSGAGAIFIAMIVGGLADQLTSA